MTNLLSPAQVRAANALETPELFLWLVTLSHPNWAAPLRLVNDHAQFVHQGDVYLPRAFEIVPPEESEGVIPVMKWTADNTDTVVSGLLRQALAGTGGGYIAASAVMVMASEPDTPVVEFPAMELRGAEYDAETASGVIGVDPVVDQPFSRLAFDPTVTPGLF